MLTGFSLAAAALSVGAHAFSGLALPLDAAESMELSNDKTLTKSFTNATAKEVFDWMKSQKLNFVVDVTKIPDKKLTLSFDNVPAETAIRAVSRALGFGWAREGDVFVLSQDPLLNRTLFGQDHDRLRMLRELNVPFTGKSNNFDFDFDFDMPDFDFDFIPYMGDGQDLTPEQKKMEEWAKRFGETMSREWSGKFSKEMMEKMKADGMIEIGPMIYRSLEPLKELELILPEGKDLTPEQKKKLEEARIKIQKLHENELKHLKDMKIRVGEMSDKERAEMKKHIEEMRMKIGDGKVHRIGSMDLKKLKESLTPEQKKFMKEKGYLELSDLTTEQKKMLGDLPPNAKVKLNLNGDSMSISITTESSESSSKVHKSTSAIL